MATEVYTSSSHHDDHYLIILSAQLSSSHLSSSHLIMIICTNKLHNSLDVENKYLYMKYCVHFSPSVLAKLHFSCVQAEMQLLINFKWRLKFTPIKEAENKISIHELLSVN